MSTSGWMDKENVVDIWNGLLSHCKEWNNEIYSNMNGPRDQRKWGKSEREINIIVYPLYVEY